MTRGTSLPSWVLGTVILTIGLTLILVSVGIALRPHYADEISIRHGETELYRRILNLPMPVAVAFYGGIILAGLGTAMLLTDLGIIRIR